MYCKQCGFHSFDHLSSCPKCGQNWETTRKTLGLQWIEEPAGSWLEVPGKTDAGDEQSGTSASQTMASPVLTGTEDDFALEEDWLLSPEENPGTVSLTEETFVFDEETHTQSVEKNDPADGKKTVIASEPPPPPREREKKTKSELSDDDLLVPGLEELLQAKNPSPISHTKPESDQSRKDILEPLAVTLEEDELSEEITNKGSDESPLVPDKKKPSEEIISRSEDLVVPGLNKMVQAADQPVAPRGETQPHRISGKNLQEDVLEIALEETRTLDSPASVQSGSSDADKQDIDLKELDISLDEKSSVSGKT
jgi:hypothetical protein